MQYDIFNGDADGIFALHQYRLAHPAPSTHLITSVKRDIALVSRVERVVDCTICVFDLSLASNLSALETVLRNNNTVHYFDHHFAGDIPVSPLLHTSIDPSAETCTSVLVNKAIGDTVSPWAICGAFGDNLHKLATKMADSISLSKEQTSQLHELGELFNYNGYGSSLADLHFHPEDLYKAVRPHQNPFSFIDSAPQLDTLRAGYKEDLERAMQQQEMDGTGKNRVYFFPDATWARRVGGVFSNLKAQERTDCAHALVTENSNHTLRISVRAPLQNRTGADTLCKKFSTGGGRAAAAGINYLPADMLDSFLSEFQSTFR